MPNWGHPRYGLGFEHRDGAVVVTRVKPDSPAEVSGLTSGIKILSINGRDVGTLDKTEMIAAADNSTRRKLLLPRPDEEPDTNPSCHVCNGDFNALRRRHHCRNCGGLCCDKCSPTKCEIPYLGYFKPERVCTDCHDTVALFSRASGVVKKGKQQIGLTSDRRAQIRAIEQIRDKITSPDCFAMVRACALAWTHVLATAAIADLHAQLKSCAGRCRFGLVCLLLNRKADFNLRFCDWFCAAHFRFAFRCGAV